MTQPTDDDLIAYLSRHPGNRLAHLCDAFGLPYSVMWYGFPEYTPEAKALARQLQRLRRAGQLQTTQGQRWEVT